MEARVFGGSDDAQARFDRDKIGLHIALTPIWSETAWFADYILPMGLGTERHDTMSQETHAAQWIGFRQPVVRVAREKRGDTINFTYESNPGEVWEESEFWAALSWRIDPDGSLGIRKHFESPYRPGQPVTISVDAYGHRKFAGFVESIAPAAGSVFTLLPPDNATGNFTKLVQRLPVRVRVPKDVARQNLLRAGMSVYATVDTRDGAKDADSEADLDAPAATQPQ